MLWRVGAGSARSEGKGEERRARGTEVSLSFDVFLCIHSVVLFSSFPFFFFISPYPSPPFLTSISPPSSSSIPTTTPSSSIRSGKSG